jgi:hypothetical protein
MKTTLILSEDSISQLEALKKNINSLKKRNISVNIIFIEKNQLLPAVKKALQKNKVKSLPVLVTPKQLIYGKEINSFFNHNSRPVIKSAPEPEPKPRIIDSGYIRDYQQDLLETGDDDVDTSSQNLQKNIAKMDKQRKADGRGFNEPEQREQREQRDQRDQRDTREQRDQREESNSQSNTSRERLEKSMMEDGDFDPEDKMMMDKFDI